MPRAKRGGAREGGAQTAYAERTDLNRRGPEPITVAPGQAYGEGKEQADAQRAVPMGGTPQPPQEVAKQSPAPEPGSLPWLHPTERPNVHIPDTLPHARQVFDAAGMPNSNRLTDALDQAAGSRFASPYVRGLAEVARQAGL